MPQAWVLHRIRTTGKRKGSSAISRVLPALVRLNSVKTVNPFILPGLMINQGSSKTLWRNWKRTADRAGIITSYRWVKTETYFK
ncbi:MAG: hypothetical protein D3908_07885 [Candidatus Electrothrix sp. AUS4]|nr:hypothetical protein [Candidatus Electrothrix sp. AUS4]